MPKRFMQKKTRKSASLPCPFKGLLTGFKLQKDKFERLGPNNGGFFFGVDLLPKTHKDIITDTPPAASVAVTAGGLHYVRWEVRKQKGIFQNINNAIFLIVTSVVATEGVL
jgi:hypothetical protein